MTAALAVREAGIEAVAAAVSVREWADAIRDFLRLDSRAISPATLRSYRAGVAAFAAWTSADGLDVTTATRRDIRRYAQTLAESGAARATVNARLSAVRTIYRAAVAAGLRGDNPADGVTAPRIEAESATAADAILDRGLAPEDAGRLLALPDRRTVEGRRDFALLALFLSTGARLSEVQGITLDALDLRGRKVRLVGKGRKVRTVRLPLEAVVPLRAWLADREKVAAEGVEAVFVTLRASRRGRRGDPMSARGIEATVEKYLRRIGHIRRGAAVHALRHAHATAAILGGATLLEVASVLGHASTRTTEKYVGAAARLSGDTTAKAAAVLFAGLSGGAREGADNVPNPQLDGKAHRRPQALRQVA